MTKDLEPYRPALHSPLPGDILDSLRHYHQFLPRHLQPMLTDMQLTGRARPPAMVDVYGEQDPPFGKLTEALDQLQAGEIYVGSLPSQSCACWGEILTATARSRGAVGAVVNGPHRDTPKVLEQNWPVFSTGRFAQDSRVRMRVADFRVPIEIEGIVIRPGDLIFGDLDGVVVIPQACESEVLDRALEKARAENLVRREIEAGLSSTEAFAKYGVL
ncbi:MAG: RraA family protein [Puniceicoccaceae bacterium]